MSFPYKLEILVPTYNRALLLAECIDSIISQRLQKDYINQVSILVVDNASSDHTQELIEEYIVKSPIPIRYIRRSSNIGFSNNLSTGISESSGEWVWLMGDDDFITPGSIQAILYCINEKIRSSCTLIKTRYLECEKDLSQFCVCGGPILADSEKTAQDFLEMGLSHLNFISQYIVKKRSYCDLMNAAENDYRFTPHLKVISRMIHGSYAYILNRFCVIGRRHHSIPSQWAGIWPVVYGFEHPDIIIGIEDDIHKPPLHLISLLNVRSWFVMSIFRDEYRKVMPVAPKPSTWRLCYVPFILIERLLDWDTARNIIRKILLKVGGQRVTSRLANARRLLGEAELG